MRRFPMLAGVAVGLVLAAPVFGDEVRVVDAVEVEVVLPAPADRVAALGNATALVAVIDGAIDRLVGTGSPDAFHNMLGVVFPDGADLIEIGGMARTPPNTETVASTDPDVVIMWTGGGAASHDAAPLIGAGLPVARYSSGTEQQMMASIRMIGELIGEPARGEQIANWRDGMRTRLEAQTAGIAAEDRQRILGLFPYGGSLSVYGGGADDPYGNFFYRAGGVNVAEEGQDLMAASVEQIAAWKPDVIVIWATPDSDITRDVVLQDPVMSQTDAAKAGRVYVIPTGIGVWGVAGAEDPFYWQWLAELIYPERVPAALRQDLKLGYEMFFGYDLSDDQVDAILRADVNAAGAGYDRFAR